jgi:hypothetical protein
MQVRSFMRVCSAAGSLLLTSAAAVATGGLPLGVPDPCTLVATAELQAIVGGFKGAPKADDAASAAVRRLAAFPRVGPDALAFSRWLTPAPSSRAGLVNLVHEHPKGSTWREAFGDYMRSMPSCGGPSPQDGKRTLRLFYVAASQSSSSSRRGSFANAILLALPVTLKMSRPAPFRSTT